MSCLSKCTMITAALVLAVTGCANEDKFEGLTLFPKIAKARKFFGQARRMVMDLDDYPVDEGRKMVDAAMKLNEKAIALVPDCSDFQFFHVLLLHKRGLYHDNQGIYWGEKSRGLKFNDEAEKWIKEFPLPSSEHREKWKRLSKQHREIANGFFVKALRRLDIVEQTRGDIPRFLDMRAKIYILMMNFQRARGIYVRLSRDTRLTDAQRSTAQEMILKIDRNEFYKKQKARDESSLFKHGLEE